ncbi:unnamed protein product [Adineta ricciae]|uniref:Uncharacterized protein n=1 Tax=Adineta ricciae TaxID=249248 RepID=A0A815G1Y3_ADIRI|nr:unnamed protein product [Adineta ricciae]CAF1333179.1 unnamed protein product [Adineta ricciae]
MNINDLFGTVFPVNGNGPLPNATTTMENSVVPSSTAFHIQPDEFEHRPITREIMLEYLSTRQHRKVTIFHAKVAQKSYGNEKRFFCPPPCVYLSGDGWTNNLDKTCSSATSSTTATFPEEEHFYATIGIGEPLFSNGHEHCLSNEMQNLVFENGKTHFGSAKTLFISDSDKRKYINLNVKLFLTNHHHAYIGLFESRKIKVISKPSKKKQSVKNAESVCIQSGTSIALFNRLRSQNVSTRFLHVDENQQFHASAHEWGSFYIHLVDTDESYVESNEFSVKDGFIQYGSTVKLVCSVTNQSLPYLIIRKVDKNCVLIDSDEPVSQLHKCAFEFKHSLSNFVYLSLLNERIIGIASKPDTAEHSRIEINDSACWTIISTDKAEYTWFESRGPVVHPITPIPVGKQMTIDGGGETATIELTGENFTPGLSVWFGETESPSTEYRSTQAIVAEVPRFSSIIPNMSWVPQSVSVPISFVRRDGIIYLTPFIFTYTPEPATN